MSRWAIGCALDKWLGTSAKAVWFVVLLLRRQAIAEQTDDMCRRVADGPF